MAPPAQAGSVPALSHRRPTDGGHGQWVVLGVALGRTGPGLHLLGDPAGGRCSQPVTATRRSRKALVAATGPSGSMVGYEMRAPLEEAGLSRGRRGAGVGGPDSVMAVATAILAARATGRDERPRSRSDWRRRPGRRRAGRWGRRRSGTPRATRPPSMKPQMGRGALRWPTREEGDGQAISAPNSRRSATIPSARDTIPAPRGAATGPGGRIHPDHRTTARLGTPMRSTASLISTTSTLQMPSGPTTRVQVRYTGLVRRLGGIPDRRRWRWPGWGRPSLYGDEKSMRPRGWPRGQGRIVVNGQQPVGGEGRDGRADLGAGVGAGGPELLEERLGHRLRRRLGRRGGFDRGDGGVEGMVIACSDSP